MPDFDERYCMAFVTISYGIVKRHLFSVRTTIYRNAESGRAGWWIEGGGGGGGRGEEAKRNKRNRREEERKGKINRN